MRELKRYEEPSIKVILIEERDIDTITASPGGGPQWDFGEDFAGWGSTY